MSTLMIVESPKKAKEIGKYLGPDFVVKLREVEKSEAELEQAREAAAHARMDGVDAAAAVAADRRTQDAQERLQSVLEREGVNVPDSGQRVSNAIEQPLSERQINKLTKKREANEEELTAGAAAAGRAAAAAPSIGEGDNQVRDQSAFNDAASKDRLVPEDVAAAFKRDGQKYLDANDPKKVAFVDKGNRLQTVRTFDDQAVAAMIQTADARGWSEVKVSGDEAFRRKAWIEATARGIEVKGYEPTEKDKMRAEQLGQQTGRTNAIEKNETVEAYRNARDGSPKDKRDAAREHPELAGAFAFEAAARSFAKQRLAPDAQERFADRTREMLERDLAQGKAVPEVRRRQEQERRQDRGVER